MTEPFIGEIRLFPYTFAPRGWAFCAGQMLPVNQNQALYALIGNTFGGDGVATFALPDLRGRVVVGGGQGPGLSPRTLAERGGTESVTLVATQLPSHTHGFALAAAEDATTKNPANALPAFTDVGPSYGTTPAGSMQASTSQPTGSSLPVANMQPYLVLNYCIALSGIFPSRN